MYTTEAIRKKDDKINKTIISHTNSIKTLRTKRKTDEELTDKEKKTLTKEQREYNNNHTLVINGD